MATTPRASIDREVDYPTSDGKPMAETDWHRQIMMDLIGTLQERYEADPMVYVSGDLLLFYERGNKRKHVAPDVFVVFGVPKRQHLNYLLWQEGKGPDVVIEVTSKTTRKEDQNKKLGLYRDILRVPEYFLFDPFQDYLKPPFQGHRLVGGQYSPIEPVAGRLPSEVLGLHLERDGSELRLHDSVAGRRLPTSRERAADAEARLGQTEARLGRVEAQLGRVEAENERLRRELDALRRRGGEA